MFFLEHYNHFCWNILSFAETCKLMENFLHFSAELTETFSQICFQFSPAKTELSRRTKIYLLQLGLAQVLG